MHYKKVWKRYVVEAKLDALDKDVTAPMKDNRDLPDDFYEHDPEDVAGNAQTSVV